MCYVSSENVASACTARLLLGVHMHILLPLRLFASLQRIRVEVLLEDGSDRYTSLAHVVAAIVSRRGHREATHRYLVV